MWYKSKFKNKIIFLKSLSILKLKLKEKFIKNFKDLMLKLFLIKSLKINITIIYEFLDYCK